MISTLLILYYFYVGTAFPIQAFKFLNLPYFHSTFHTWEGIPSSNVQQIHL